MGYKYNPFTGELDRVDDHGNIPTQNRYPITPYVVGPVGQAGYQTIQAAINAATAAGGTNVIWVQPGTYTEDLNITSSIQFMSIDGVATIVGVHTPPSSGTVNFDGFSLVSATDILNSNAAGTTVFNINNCFIVITNGYIFNVPNWTGEILMDNCGEASTEDGVINNASGGSSIKLINVEMGAGSKTMELNGDASGFLRFDTCNVNCPVNMSGAGEVLFQNGVRFGKTVTIGGSLEGFSIETCWHDTNGDPLSTAAIVYNSSGDFIFSDGAIASTNDPAIDGTGSGTITMSGIDFSNSSTISSSLTVAGGNSYSGTYKSDYTDHAVLIGQGAVEDIVASNVGTDGQLLIAGTALDPAFASLTSTGGTVTFTPGPNSLNLEATSAALQFDADSGSAVPAGDVINVNGDTDQGTVTSASGNTIDVVLGTNTQETAIHAWNGSVIETADVSVTSDGVTITCSVEQNGGGDLTVVFSDGFYTWDTTPADTVTLTAGTDTSPQLNYVYFLQSTKTLTASTTGFPATEYAPIATVICQSAATLQTDGPYKQQNWTDHVIDTTEQGHISHLNFWIRQQPATWVDGVAQTYTITTNVGTPDNVFISTASGTALQLHENTFPAFANADDYYVINDKATPYSKVNDLNALLTDSTGSSMSKRYFSLVLWGSVNSNGESKRFINLPNGSYSNQADLEEDPNRYAVYTIPAGFRSTGFLISEWRLRHRAARGGTWTSIEEIDLRGQIPNLSAGGGNVSPVTFDDSVFRIYDDGDNTKEIAFQASAITTATTRTITMVDADLDLADVATTFNADSGSATPSTNVITFAGGNGCSTSASGSTVTIDLSGGGLDWTEITVTGPTTLSANEGAIANNASTVGLTLPVTASIGDIIKVDGKGSGGWSIGQNAGQTIHFLAQDTTTGAGGSLASTGQYDCVTLRCITADTDFIVETSVGNITVT